MKLNNINYQPMQLNQTGNIASNNTQQVSFKGHEEVDQVYKEIEKLEKSEKFQRANLDKFGKVKSLYHNLLEYFSSQKEKYTVEKLPTTEKESAVPFGVEKEGEGYLTSQPCTETKKEAVIKNKQGEILGLLSLTMGDSIGERILAYNDVQVKEIWGLRTNLEAKRGLSADIHVNKPVMYDVNVKHNVIAHGLSDKEVEKMLSEISKKK